MKERVIIRNCQDYDSEKISRIILEGMEELGTIPHGKVLLKPMWL